MVEQIPASTTIMVFIFTAISIVIFISQILLRKRYQFLELCKVFIFLPLVTIIIQISNAAAQALNMIVEANDLSNAVLYDGFVTMLFSLTLGLYITIFLAILYGVTAALYENQA